MSNDPNITSAEVTGSNELTVRINIPDRYLESTKEYLEEKVETDDDTDNPYYVLRETAGIHESDLLQELTNYINQQLQEVPSEEPSPLLNISNQQLLELMAKFLTGQDAEYLLEDFGYDMDIDLYVVQTQADPASINARIERAAEALGQYIDNTPRAQIVRGEMKRIAGEALGSVSQPTNSDLPDGALAWK